MGSKNAPKVYTCNLPNAKNEDRYSQYVVRRDGSDITILGVYDGHGGSACAEYISKALPERIAAMLERNKNISVEECLKSSFIGVDDSILEDLHHTFRSYVTWPLPRSVRQKIIDRKLKESESAREIALRAKDGSTALVAIIEGEWIIVGNVGDCRAVLGRSTSPTGIEAVDLTIDQNGDKEGERERIFGEHPGEEANMLIVGGRLFGHMAVTRSFGDVFFKEPNKAYTEFVFGSPRITESGKLPYNETVSHFCSLMKTPPYLTAVPEVMRYKISTEDRFLVVASDGVWGVKGVTSEWAIGVVEKGLGIGVDGAEFMVEQVKKLGVGDDITVLVVNFGNDGVI
ncbi:protein serine/threonine phosphatase 2C [Tothia fuscella]|uniref:Protein serine/threonine phosphatase 2C n=1 Tax=Tothia fuscella TaxID=1048955 RepID=A0A9P4U205_9PEZI|nr:protein serine/threonine phosphatase 2C [Tothia fuscella]